MAHAASAPFVYSAPRSQRAGLTWTVAFSILLHVAAGWYFISRFVIDRAEQEPPEIAVIPMAPLPPLKSVPLPEIKSDPVKPVLPIRDPIRWPDAPPMEPIPAPPAPAAAPSPGPITSPGPVAPALPALAPSPTRRVQPEYPERAAMRGVAGSATIYLVVGQGGDVVDAQIAEEDPENYGFGAAALKAVRRWQFEGSQPGTYRVTVKFKP